MKELLVISVLLLFGCVEENTAIFFCPEDACAVQLENAFVHAEKSIDVAVYSITLDDLAIALVSAHKKGISVRVITDSLQAGGQYSDDEYLERNGIPVKRVWKKHASMHNKFAIVDGKSVSTGSFNYSQNANEKNDENLVFVYDRKIVKAFQKKFEELWNN